jgi:hypothetical protein
MNGNSHGNNELKGHEVRGDNRDLPSEKSQNPKHAQNGKDTAKHGQDNPPNSSENDTKGDNKEAEYANAKDPQVTLHKAD